MTLNDFLSRFYGSSVRGYMNSATVGQSAIEIIAASPQRVAIAFGPPSAGIITVGPVPPGQLAFGLGFNCQLNAGLMDFKFDNAGNTPSKPWSAVADAAGRLIGWVEILLD